MLIRIIITLIISSVSLYAQGSSTYGNLIRIPIDASQINPADTIGNWISYNYDLANGSSRYRDIIHTFSDTFFEKYSRDDYHYFGPYIDYSLENFEADTSGSYGTFVDVVDIVEPYLIQYTIPFKTEGGTWLMNGIINTAFLADDGTLTILPGNYYGDLLYICTEIDGKYLTVFRRDTTELAYDFYLLDLSNSPDFDTTGAQKVYFDIPAAPYKIRKLNDSLYIVQADLFQDQDGALSLFSLENNTFNFIKKFFTGSTYEWEYNKGSLIRYNFSNLVKYDYNREDTSFINERILLPGGGIYSNKDFSLSVKISGDSLLIYDDKAEQYINEIDISTLRNPQYPLIDSPYVYLHQTTLVTRVEDKILQPLKYNLQIYPNPFNPATNILYTIPERSSVGIKLFDMLGREVMNVYSGENEAGSHKILLNAGNLASGIYFISFRSGDYFEVQKILLLK